VDVEKELLIVCSSLAEIIIGSHGVDKIFIYLYDF
jgi:hypothetical protein